MSKSDIITLPFFEVYSKIWFTLLADVIGQTKSPILKLHKSINFLHKIITFKLILVHCIHCIFTSVSESSILQKYGQHQVMAAPDSEFLVGTYENNILQTFRIHHPGMQILETG